MEIANKSSNLHYTLEDVANELRQHFYAMYDKIMNHSITELPKFNIVLLNNISKWRWSYGDNEKCAHWLIIPKNKADFDGNQVSKWLEEQGFVFTSNENYRYAGWDVK